jgi:hypothetical protein
MRPTGLCEEPAPQLLGAAVRNAQDEMRDHVLQTRGRLSITPRPDAFSPPTFRVASYLELWKSSSRSLSASETIFSTSSGFFPRVFALSIAFRTAFAKAQQTSTARIPSKFRAQRILALQ